MSIGSSGRIVIEIEPESKRRLYSALAKDGLTLKDWFLKNAELYVNDRNYTSPSNLSMSYGNKTVMPEEASESNEKSANKS